MAQLCARIVVDRSSSHLKKNNHGAIYILDKHMVLLISHQGMEIGLVHSSTSPPSGRGGREDTT
jgi:hypothetical protein